MASHRKMNKTFSSLPLIPSLLLLLAPYSLSANPPTKSSNIVNVTTLSTYSISSLEQPGNVAPWAGDSRRKGAQPEGEEGTRPYDSSAAASGDSEQSVGAPGGYGSRHPSHILGKPSGEGHWATPAPHSGIELPYVPYKMFAQVRHTYEVNHKPQSDAIASATTAEEAAAAARLRESIQTKKISEVYSEEGYEDSAYDHAGFKKDAGFSEGHEEHEGAKRKSGDRRKGGGGISEAATTSEAQKYPFHSVPSSEAVPILSPLRYALNPASDAIPAKTEGGTEFYDSTEDTDCPAVVQLPPIPGRRLRGPPEEEGGEEEAEEGEGKTHEPQPTPSPPPTPRLKGLGDKIDCLRKKFFGGEEPLDNPLFKEQVVNVARNEIKKEREEESRRKEKLESSGQESRDAPLKRKEKEDVSARVVEAEAEGSSGGDAAVVESEGEDRIGVDAEDSSTGGVGAAVEGLPSGPASDSDMEGFYADIMGHIRSATGAIVRQAYSGSDGSASGERVSRVRPPKPPKPPIIGFFPTQGDGSRAVQYPSVLAPPRTRPYGDYAAADQDRGYDVEEEEEGEKFSGSEREEEEGDEDEEPPGHHHHHHHPNFIGGSQKPASLLLRPLHSTQPQQFYSGGGATEVPFRPSPLLYIHRHNSPTGVAPSPSHAAPNSHPSGGKPPPVYHLHPHYPRPTNTPPQYQSTGIRTFLIPSGKRPSPFTVPPSGHHHYHANPVGGFRGAGTVLVSGQGRQYPVFSNGILYPTRGPPLKRQLPVGREFDGLLTATTHATSSVAAPPEGFGRPFRQQPLSDLVASPSFVAHSIAAPRNIEYFTSKDSLPSPYARKSTQDPQQLSHASETLIPQIAFTTTEKNPQPYPHNADPEPVPNTPETSGDNHAERSASQSSFTSGAPRDRSSNAWKSASSYDSDSSKQPESFLEESMETSDTLMESTVAGTGLGVPKLVTEQVAKGIVRGAIEEGAKKRRKNPEVVVASGSATSGEGETETKERDRRRRRNRFNGRGVQGRREEDPSGEMETDDGGKRVSRVEKGAAEGERNRQAIRTIDSRRERTRRGEKGASRTRVGLAADGQNVGLRAGRGRKRGEPGHTPPTDEEDVATGDGSVTGESGIVDEHYESEMMKRTKNDGNQHAENRAEITPTASRVAHAPLDPRHTDGNVKSVSEISRHQRNEKSDQPSEEVEPSATREVDDVRSETQTTDVEADSPRKIFIEPRVRGERKMIRIPKKIATRARGVSAQYRTSQNVNRRNVTGSAGNGGSIRSGVSPEPTLKNWELSKGRILTSLEGGSRRHGRQRENTGTSAGTGVTANRPANSEIENQDSNKKQRIVRHREVKETFTSVYEPEEEV